MGVGSCKHSGPSLMLALTSVTRKESFNWNHGENPSPSRASNFRLKGLWCEVYIYIYRYVICADLTNTSGTNPRSTPCGYIDFSIVF